MTSCLLITIHKCSHERSRSLYIQTETGSGWVGRLRGNPNIMGTSEAEQKSASCGQDSEKASRIYLDLALMTDSATS